MDRKYLVGIDPGRTNTGIAIYEAKAKTFTHLAKYDLARAIDQLQTMGIATNCIVVIENPNLETNLYDGWAQMKSVINSYKRNNASLECVKSVFKVATKRASDVGKNQAAAQDLIAALKQMGAPTVQVKPSDRQRADRAGMAPRDVAYLNMPTKTTAEQFNELTNYSGRSNEHSRDAATLVWAKTTKWAEMMMLRQKHWK